MTKLLDKALEAARLLPPEAQDEIARAILSMADNEAEPEPVAPEHLSAVLEGLAQVRAGALADERDVEASFCRFEE